MVLFVLTVDEAGDEIESNLNLVKDFTAFLILLDVQYLIQNREVQSIKETKGDLLDDKFIKLHEMFQIYTEEQDYEMECKDYFSMALYKFLQFLKYLVMFYSVCNASWVFASFNYVNFFCYNAKMKACHDKIIDE